MARRISSKTVLNRKCLTAIRAGMVDGMEDMGGTIVSQTDPPDDPLTSEKIDGDWGIWVDGRKVAGTATKPRGLRNKSGITLAVGFEFPARFNELGTVHQPARPFFTPRVFEVMPGAARYISPRVKAKLRGVR